MDEIPKKATGLVGDILAKQDKRGTKDLYIKEFQLENVLTRKTEVGRSAVELPFIAMLWP